MLMRIFCAVFGLSAKFQTFKRRYSLLASCHLFSSRVVTSLTRMRVIPVSALSDNYMYILIDEKTKACAVVDPVESEKLLKHISDEGGNLTTILTTHHHYDHAGGNSKLAQLVKGLMVYGGEGGIGALNHRVKHEEKFKVGSLEVTALSTPCHTSGHVCYYIANDQEGEPGVVFTGDTLFIAGCGRFFEGSATDMYHALVDVLGTLPPSTLVYCGHEYTVKNLKFAATVEPNSSAVADKLAWAKAQRDKGQPTVPSSIAEEFSFNPFMRVCESGVQAHAGRVGDAIGTMAAIRAKKDIF